MEDKDKIIAELKAENERLKEDKIGLHSEIKQLEQENATYKANADAVQKYITQNEQLKTHIDGLEKKNAELKAYKDVNEDFKTAWEELKAENARLKSCLQEIKEIAEQILNKNEFVYQNHRDIRQIVRLITKAESEGQDADVQS